MKDIFGKALLDYQNGNYTEDIITSTSISDKEVLSLHYLFRNYSNMPILEQKALQLVKGKVIDIGCGSGNHSLFLIKKGFIVKSIDISKGAIDVCKKRGLKNAHCLDFLYEIEKFDTILILMNGTGLFKKMKNVSKVLAHLKSLLNQNGQILIDSSDIKYMYEYDDGYWDDMNTDYYGELEYHISYKGEQESFPWLYIDFENLKTACEVVGMNCELVLEGEHYDYLARITVIEPHHQ